MVERWTPVRWRSRLRALCAGSLKPSRSSGQPRIWRFTPRLRVPLSSALRAATFGADAPDGTPLPGSLQVKGCAVERAYLSECAAYTSDGAAVPSGYPQNPETAPSLLRVDEENSRPFLSNPAPRKLPPCSPWTTQRQPHPLPGCLRPCGRARACALRPPCRASSRMRRAHPYPSATGDSAAASGEIAAAWRSSSSPRTLCRKMPKTHPRFRCRSWR